MVACVYGDEVAIKLPSARAEELLGQADIAPFQPYGKAKMREWIALRYRNEERNAFIGLLREAVAYVHAQTK